MSVNLADLNAAAASETIFDLELKHPTTDAPLGLFIQVLGSQSDRVRAVANKQSNALINESFTAQRRGKNAPITVETSQLRAAELAAAATVGWYEQQPAKAGEKPKREEGLPFGEKRLMFSEEEAVRLYSDPAYSWLAKQVDEAVGDLSNFLTS